MAQGSSALGQRCAGRFAVNRIPYPVDQALAVLKDVSKLVLVCAKHPVAFFAYPDKPSLLTPADCHVLPLATLEQDMLDALERLADALGAKTAEPNLQKLARPALQTGALHPDSITATLGALLPERADEPRVWNRCVSTGSLRW